MLIIIRKCSKSIDHAYLDLTSLPAVQQPDIECGCFLFLQDTLGGGFDATQAFVGELANFNIWDRKLTAGEIYNLATCNNKAQAGNVLSWSESNIDVFGGATKWTFEPCRQLN